MSQALIASRGHLPHRQRGLGALKGWEPATRIMKTICLKSQKKEFKINVDLDLETDGSVQLKRFESDCYCLVAYLRGFQIRND